jgi:hypothetical protein
MKYIQKPVIIDAVEYTSTTIAKDIIDYNGGKVWQTAQGLFSLRPGVLMVTDERGYKTIMTRQELDAKFNPLIEAEFKRTDNEETNSNTTSRECGHGEVNNSGDTTQQV